jgi:hypothetical protein
LKGFAVARKKSHHLTVFDKKSGETFSAATSKIAVEMDFNRVEIEGHPPDVVEKAMSEFETEAAAALQQIVAAKSIQQTEDRSYLLNLIGLLAVRNPRLREIHRDFEERVMKQVMRARAKAAGYIRKDAPIEYAKTRELVTEDKYRVEVPTGRHIILEMGGLEAILPYLFQRKWALFKCESTRGVSSPSVAPVALSHCDI